MSTLKLALGVCALSLVAAGCWVVTIFPLDGTNGMQGEYGGLLKRSLKGRDTQFSGGTSSSVEHESEEEGDQVIIIEKDDITGAVIFGLECDLPVDPQGPQELSLGGDVTCTRRRRDVTSTLGSGTQTIEESVTTYTFNELVVKRTGSPREITLEAAGKFVEAFFLNGAKTRENAADFEYSYEGTRISTE